MAETTNAVNKTHRKTVVGNVVSTKMHKTIVVEVERRKAHPLYRRVVRMTKKFYAHDEGNTARVGDVVRVDPECRPLLRVVAAAFDAYLRPEGGRHAVAV